jgi:hypothetical protein
LPGGNVSDDLPNIASTNQYASAFKIHGAGTKEYFEGIVEAMLGKEETLWGPTSDRGRFGTAFGMIG